MSNTPVIHQSRSSDSPAVTGPVAAQQRCGLLCFVKAPLPPRSPSPLASPPRAAAAAPLPPQQQGAKSPRRRFESEEARGKKPQGERAARGEVRRGCESSSFLFKHEKGKEEKKGQGWVWYLLVALTGFISTRSWFLREGAPEIELTLHLMSFLVAYSLSL